VLARLGVRLAPAGAGDCVWDVFALAYALAPPLTAVVPPAAAAAYAALSRLRRLSLPRVAAARHRAPTLGHGGRGAWRLRARPPPVSALSDAPCNDVSTFILLRGHSWQTV
jgi:hypothetical protein